MSDGCGFDDVRLNTRTGDYYCIKCKKNLGSKFRESVRLQLSPEWVQKLDKQCREQGNDTEAKVQNHSGHIQHGRGNGRSRFRSR